MRIVFPEITTYTEKNGGDALDDKLMDGLVSMDWVGDNQVEIITCKKEISLELTGKPFAEKWVSGI